MSFRSLIHCCSCFVLFSEKQKPCSFESIRHIFTDMSLSCFVRHSSHYFTRGSAGGWGGEMAEEITYFLTHSNKQTGNAHSLHVLLVCLQICPSVVSSQYPPSAMSEVISNTIFSTAVCLLLSLLWIIMITFPFMLRCHSSLGSLGASRAIPGWVSWRTVG